MILLIDNYDSFTYNLVQRLGEIDPQLELEVHRNDQITLDEIARREPTHLIISPGPCTPSEAGISCECVTRFAGQIPILGVCLGHQAIGQATGAQIVRAERLMHGKTDWIHHDGQGLFAGLDNPFQAARYHSLVIKPGTLSDDFVVCAWSHSPDGSREIMGVRHKSQQLFGVQFHPESFLTLSGVELLKRFLAVPPPAAKRRAAATGAERFSDGNLLMLTVDEALQRVLEQARPRTPARVPLARSLGLVLAEAIASDVDSPPHDKSIVDGYAVLAGDAHASAGELAVIEEVTAGQVPQRPLEPGQATRIMTGAPLPNGADAVVMVERTEFAAAAVGDRSAALGRVKLLDRHVLPGQNIMRRAASLTRGETVLHPGTFIRAAELGLLAEVGRSEVLVHARPRVAVLPTGNELVPIDQKPAPGQIRNSNGPMLLAAVREAGAEPVELAVARDDEASLRHLIVQGLQSDILVISGGVSAGKLDLVPKVLADVGAEQVFHKVSLKPGKPLWFGVLRDGDQLKLVFGLPGNPVSSFVCFRLFVAPAIARLAGRAVQPALTCRLPLAKEFKHRGDRPTYHPARVLGAGEAATVEPLAWQGSGDLATLTRASALAYFPAGDRTVAAGELIETMLL